MQEPFPHKLPSDLGQQRSKFSLSYCHRGGQLLRLRVLRVGKQIGSFNVFDDSSPMHHDDFVGHMSGRS